MWAVTKGYVANRAPGKSVRLTQHQVSVNRGSNLVQDSVVHVMVDNCCLWKIPSGRSVAKVLGRSGTAVHPLDFHAHQFHQAQSGFALDRVVSSAVVNAVAEWFVTNHAPRNRMFRTDTFIRRSLGTFSGYYPFHDIFGATLKDNRPG